MLYMLHLKLKKLLALSLAAALLLPSAANRAEAGGAVTTVTYKSNINMAKLTPSLMKKIAASTPKESASSDLTLIHPATRISTKRLPQSYTFDGTYYYYLSNVANVGSKKNTLRLTRVKYTSFNTYTESYMTLQDFGHGTGIDCLTLNGKTYLWVVSDKQCSISCFTFKSGKTLKKHASVHYRIPIKGTSKYASNVAPAIDPSGKVLAVRYTRNGKQYFQYYKIKDGKKINPKKPYKTFKLSSPKATFQGFDISGNHLYTVEGTRSKSECKEIHESYYPIKIRTYNIKTGAKSCQTIKGAAKLSHREPEGIRVTSDGGIYLDICSHYKDKYTVVNVYQVKK